MASDKADARARRWISSSFTASGTESAWTARWPEPVPQTADSDRCCSS